MRKALVRDIILLLSLCLLCSADRCIGQLRIGSGTTWVSSSDTYVVLNDLGLEHDATPVLLNNVFRFTGSATSTIGGSTPPSINAISLAKTSPGSLALRQTLNIKKRIYFGSGLFDLNKNAINLDPNALLTNENELSRLIGPSGGYISIVTDLHAPVAANPGNIGALITSATELGKVTVTRSHDIQILNDSSKSIARWYTISVPDNIPPFSTGLRFHYFYAESEGYNNDSLVVWEGSDNTDWDNLGYTTRDASQKYVEKQGVTRLSRFTLSPGPSASTPPVTPPSTPVPGPLVLTGNWVKDFVLLHWTAVSEYGTDHFSIERKYAGASVFTAIAAVPTTAPGGTSAAPTNYSFTDSTVTTGLDDVSYRIHEIGTNGQSLYSNIITLKAIGGKKFVDKLYPTIAVGGRVYLRIGNMLLQKMSFVIIDAKGSIILTGELPYQSQWLPVNVLSKGLYRLILRSGDQKFQSTFIK